MRNEEKSGRKQKGLLLITMGLLLIAAALILVSYNLYDGLRAERAGQRKIFHNHKMTRRKYKPYHQA